MIFKRHKKNDRNIEEQLDPILVDLLAEVRKIYNVGFAEHRENDASIYTINKDATIYYNPRLFSNDSIAHELLHVWLKTLDYFTSNHIYLAAKENPKLSLIFSKRLCDHIGNCQDHIKMYPKYLEMGYAPESFIRDSTKEQCSFSSINSLHLGNGYVLNGEQTDFYIGSLISIYAHHIPMDYSAHLSKLRSIDTELFDIVTAFWKEWEKFDITKIDFLNNGFDEYEKLLADMEEWVENKTII